MRSFFLAAFAGLPAFVLPAAARDITDGVAITDSDTMEYLESHGLALNALLSENWQLGAPVDVADNAELAAIAPIAAMRNVVRAEFLAYQKSYLARSPIVKGAVDPADVGTGTDPLHRKFERNYLDSKAARFNLAGVINRMDRAYRSPETCGEIRLLYRLAYNVKAALIKPGANGRPVRTGELVDTESRLPVSLNLVLRAKNTDGNPADDKSQCQDLAKRWLDAGNSGLKGKDLALSLLKPEGALAKLDPSQIDRLETNIQVMRLPTTVSEGFGGNAEYLLNIFNWNPGTKTFDRKRLENQINRAALLRDPAMLAAFKAWLFTPERLHELDEGTITIPDQYLAYNAITSAPGGTARATNRPFLGLISNEDAKRAFNTLKDAAGRLSPDGKLRNIKSADALQQRFTDITCTGCHQSRAIGGFHFMGADRKATINDLPQNAIFVAGSPHFYGDLPRRYAVVKAIADGTPPDFGRGFSMRPADSIRGNARYFPKAFNGVLNGWGSNCYTKKAGDPGADPSFTSWQCAKGLVCQPIHVSQTEPKHGVCMHTAKNAARMKVGDPFVFGEMTFKKNAVRGERDNDANYTYRDEYCAKIDVMNDRTAPQRKCIEPIPGSKTYRTKSREAGSHGYQFGGFFGGMIRRKGCAADNDPDTVCASEGGAPDGPKRIEGLFADCVALLKDEKSSFTSCITSPKFTHASTLRACSELKPCRDDYVCVSTKSTLRSGQGACLPPYFLFQFRTDGHPAPPEGPAAPPECLLAKADTGIDKPAYCSRYPSEG